jgi:glycosyltransferase 2 family protein
MHDGPPADLPILPIGTHKARAPRRSLLRRLVSWLPALVALPALIAAVVHYGSTEKFIELARTARPEWMLPALATQCATYVFAALSWHQVLAKASEPRPFRTPFRLSVAKRYTDQAIPTGGVSGSILVVKALARRGAPGRIAMAALLVSMVSYYGADVIAALACLALLWLHHDADGPLLGLVSVFVLIEVAIPAAVLWTKSRASHDELPAWVDRLPGAES